MVTCKFDGHISHEYFVICKSIVPFIMYYGSGLLLFTRKLHYLQTFGQVTACYNIGTYLCTKF